MADYCTWQDVYAHLDRGTYPEPNMVRMGQEVDTAEITFNNQLIARYDLPFDSSDNPEAYEMAQQIVSRWAAAGYIRWIAQSQGTTTNLWYADKLDEQANQLMKFFLTRKRPEDADEAEDPVTYIPVSVAAKTGNEPDAMFKRAHVTAGSTYHW